MEAIQRVVMMTAAQSRLMVFFPNLTIASTERENAAKLHSLATDPTPYSHKHTLHRYCGGLGCSGPITARTAEVPPMKTATKAINSPARRRLMRKSRSGRGIDRALPSVTAVTPITTPATSAIIVSRME